MEVRPPSSEPPLKAPIKQWSLYDKSYFYYCEVLCEIKSFGLVEMERLYNVGRVTRNRDTFFGLKSFYFLLEWYKCKREMFLFSPKKFWFAQKGERAPKCP